MANLGGALNVGSSLLGGVMQSRAASKAADTQAESAREAIEAQREATEMAIGEQRRQFDTSRADLAPWRQAGKQTLGQLSGMLRPGGELMQRFGAEQFQESPGYQWRFNEGQRATGAQGSALGRYMSGAQAKALTRWGQGLASEEYGAAYNRNAADQQRQYNMLAGVSGLGQGSAGQVANLGANAASRIGQFATQGAGNIGNLQTQIGNVQAAGGIGSANAWGNALGNISNYAQTQNLLNQFRPSQQPRFSSGYGGAGQTSALTGAGRF